MSDTFLLEPAFQFSAALDPHRRNAYEKAIREAAKKMGGTPSIALIGWQAATLVDVALEVSERVFIVEKNPALFESIQNAVMTRGIGKNVSLFREDAASVHLDSRVDIAVTIVHSPWFMETPAAQILTNIRKNVLKPEGVMIPRRFVHLFELASSATDISGISLRVPRYGRPGEVFAVLGESKHWSTTDFTHDEDFTVEIDDTIIVKPLLSGTLTGLRLSTLVELTDNTVHLAGHSGYQSLFMPLREELDVKAHEPVTIFARFRMGEGLKASRFMARHIDDSETPAAEISPVVLQKFHDNVAKMIAQVDELGRGADLDKVVTYTFDPHGDVTRLTALFWTVDDDFRKPLKTMVEDFRRHAAQAGSTPTDEQIYNIMLDSYRSIRSGERS